MARIGVVLGERSWHRSVATLFVLAFTGAGLAQDSMTPATAGRTLNTVSVSQLRVPEKARDQMLKAIADMRKNDFAEAMKHSSAAIAIWPDYSAALTLRGFIELQTNNPAASENDLEHALLADPNFGPAYLHLASVLNLLGRHDEALQRLEQDAVFQPNSWERAYEMARAWMGKHDYARTLEQINRAASLGGEAEASGAIHFLRGRALAGLHQNDLATRELELSLSVQPTGPLADLARELLGTMERQRTLATKQLATK